MRYTNDDLTALIEHTLNLHSIDAVVNLIADIVERSNMDAYDKGYSIGWNDCYDTYVNDIEEEHNNEVNKL